MVIVSASGAGTSEDNRLDLTIGGGSDGESYGHCLDEEVCNLLVKDKFTRVRMTQAGAENTNLLF